MVRWTRDEIAQIVDSAVSALRAHNIQHPTNTDILIAVRSAQQVLPSHRRRPLEGFKNIAKLADPIREALILKGLKDCVPDCVPACHEQNATEAPKELSLLEELLGPMLEVFIDRVVDRVLEKLQESGSVPSPKESDVNLLEVVTSVKHNPHPSDNTCKCRRLILGVVGLLPKQQKAISAQFPSVSFKFYDKAPKKSHVDYMIGMVGFLGHAVDHALQRMFGSRYYRLSNGMSQLVSKVNELSAKFGEAT